MQWGELQKLLQKVERKRCRRTPQPPAWGHKRPFKAPRMGFGGQQFQIRRLTDYACIPPAAQARASKATRLNPAGSSAFSAPCA